MSVYSYLLYFLKDTLHPNYTVFYWTLSSAEEAQGVVMAILFAFALASSILSGSISDKLLSNPFLGRRLITMLSGILIAICNVIAVAYPNLNLLCILAVFLGIGIGAFVGVDFGLANDVIQQEQTSKELAVWNIANVLPFVFAIPLTGLLISAGTELSSKGVVPVKHLGYVFMFGLMASMEVLASVLVMCIRKEEKKEPPFTEQVELEESEI